MYNQGQYPAGPHQQRYGPPPGNPYGGYGPGYGGGYGYGYADYPPPRRGRSSNNSALPMLGALAGGLLLGDLLF